jgi:hypothetical protein
MFCIGIKTVLKSRISVSHFHRTDQCAAKFISGSSASRFVPKPVRIIDVDDGRVSNFKDEGEDIKFDIIVNVYDEAIPQLTVEFVTKCKTPWIQLRQHHPVKKLLVSGKVGQRISWTHQTRARTFFRTNTPTVTLASTTGSSTTATPLTVDSLVDEAPADPVLDKDHFFTFIILMTYSTMIRDEVTNEPNFLAREECSLKLCTKLDLRSSFILGICQ